QPGTDGQGKHGDRGKADADDHDAGTTAARFLRRPGLVLVVLIVAAPGGSLAVARLLVRDGRPSAFLLGRLFHLFLVVLLDGFLDDETILALGAVDFPADELGIADRHHRLTARTLLLETDLGGHEKFSERAEQIPGASRKGFTERGFSYHKQGMG